MSSWSRHKYTPINADPTEKHDEERQQEKPTWFSPIPNKKTVLVWFVAVVLAITMFAGAGIVQYYRPPPDQANQPSSVSCGNTSSEAISRGCKFDQLMWAWVPPQCSHFANEAYLQAEPDQPWQFHAEPYSRKPLTEEQWALALNNELSVFSERREHAGHCVYMLLSYSQMVLDGGRYIQKYKDREHIEHCAEMLMGYLRRDETGFTADVFAGPVTFGQTC